MKKTSATIIIVLVTGLFCCAQAGELPKTAKILPPETIFLADIHNFNQLKTLFEKTNLYKLYKDPSMAAFVESTKTKLLDKLKGENDEFAKLVIESKLVPQGRLAIAILAPKGENDEPVFVLISQWGTNTDKIKQLLDKDIKKSIEAGQHERTETYRGVDIITMIEKNQPKIVPDFYDSNSEQNDISPQTIPQPDTMTHHCFIDDCLLISTDIEIIKFVIAHIQGATSTTMFSESDFSSSIATTGPEHDIDFYLNAKELFKTLSQKAPADFQSTLNNMGLSNLSSISSSVAVAKTPQNPFACKVFVKIDGAKKGIFNMLDIQSASVKAPKFIPDSTSSISFINIDIKNFYDQLATILNSFSPGYATMMYMDIVPPSQDGKPGIGLKRDIIEYLGKQIIISQSVSKPFSKSTVPQYLLAVEVNNKAALEKAFNAIYSKFVPGDSDAVRQFMGYTIYTLKTSLPFAPGMGRTKMDLGSDDQPQKTAFAFTITDSHLIFGIDKTIEQAVRNLNDPESTSIASKKWFNAAKDQIPEMAGFAGMEDTIAQMEFIWWTLKNSKPQDQESEITMFNPFGNLMDTSNLPQFEAVKKYFGISTSYGISRPDGFFFELKDVVTP